MGGFVSLKPFVSNTWKSVPYIFLSIINAVIDFRRFWEDPIEGSFYYWG
jgi:hypothetical protein